MHTTTAPTRAVLGAALDAAADGGLLTALHLALPADVAAQLSVERSPAELCWRGVRAPVTGDPATDAVRLAAAGRHTGERHLDLAGPVTGWVKILTSGHRKLVFGTTLVLGLPPVVARTDVDDERILTTVACLYAGTAGAGHRCRDAGTYVAGGRRLLTISNS